MVYDVREVARYMVYSASKQNIPISNLKLQKLLYFLWKEYYQKTHKYIFSEAFSAWKFGPVQTEVYFDYYMFGAAAINMDFSSYNDTGITQEDKEFIDALLFQYKDWKVYDLVERTHKKGCAWDRTFQQGEGNNKKISFEDIKEDIDNGK